LTLPVGSMLEGAHWAQIAQKRRRPELGPFHRLVRSGGRGAKEDGEAAFGSEHVVEDEEQGPGDQHRRG